MLHQNVGSDVGSALAFREDLRAYLRPEQTVTHCRLCGWACIDGSIKLFYSRSQLGI